MIETREGRSPATIPPAYGRYSPRGANYLVLMANAGDPIPRSTTLHFEVRQRPVETPILPPDVLSIGRQNAIPAICADSLFACRRHPTSFPLGIKRTKTRAQRLRQN